jgi:glycosyltransferase involved in cell wall biosynthesis
MKETLALSDRYEVIILGWDREGEYNRCENIGSNITLKRLPLKAPYGNTSIILYYPIFWIWVIINLVMMKPDIVHACDFDALIPARIFRLFNRCRIVFDNFDKFAMAFIPMNKRFLFNLIDWFEDLLAYKSDLLIVVSPERLSTFRWVPDEIALVMNCPEDIQITDPRKYSIDQYKSNTFVLVYAGVISYDRGLLLLERAIRNIDDVNLLVAGRPVQQEILDRLLKNPKVEYHGLLSPSKAIEIQAQADAIPLLYNPAVPINRVANPNKLFEAMMLGIPVISNVCKTIVESVGCGVSVNYDIECVRSTIMDLIQTPESQQVMGLNGRFAFEMKYNWTLMKRRLLTAYQKILDLEKR